MTRCLPDGTSATAIAYLPIFTAFAPLKKTVNSTPFPLGSTLGYAWSNSPLVVSSVVNDFGTAPALASVRTRPEGPNPWLYMNPSRPHDAPANPTSESVT